MEWEASPSANGPQDERSSSKQASPSSPFKRSFEEFYERATSLGATSNGSQRSQRFSRTGSASTTNEPLRQGSVNATLETDHPAKRRSASRSRSQSSQPRSKSSQPTSGLYRVSPSMSLHQFIMTARPRETQSTQRQTPSVSGLDSIRLQPSGFSPSPSISLSQAPLESVEIKEEDDADVPSMASEVSSQIHVTLPTRTLEASNFSSRSSVATQNRSVARSQSWNSIAEQGSHRADFVSSQSENQLLEAEKQARSKQMRADEQARALQLQAEASVQILERARLNRLRRVKASTHTPSLNAESLEEALNMPSQESVVEHSSVIASEAQQQVGKPEMRVERPKRTREDAKSRAEERKAEVEANRQARQEKQRQAQEARRARAAERQMEKEDKPRTVTRSKRQQERDHAELADSEGSDFEPSDDPDQPSAGKDACREKVNTKQVQPVVLEQQAQREAEIEEARQLAADRRVKREAEENARRLADETARRIAKEEVVQRKADRIEARKDANELVRPLAQANARRHDAAYNNAYRLLLNENIYELDHPFYAYYMSETSELEDSYVGGTLWTAADKEIFFEATARFSHDVKRIAAEVGKSVLEVSLYLNLLEQGLKEQKYRLEDEVDAAGNRVAAHVPESSEELLEAFADGLAWEQFKLDIAREIKHHGQKWLIVEDDEDDFEMGENEKYYGGIEESDGEEQLEPEEDKEELSQDESDESDVEDPNERILGSSDEGDSDNEPMPRDDGLLRSIKPPTRPKPIEPQPAVHRRRRRIGTDCKNCRNAKHKCTREQPVCLRCVREGLVTTCMYTKSVQDPGNAVRPQFQAPTLEEQTKFKNTSSRKCLPCWRTKKICTQDKPTCLACTRMDCAEFCKYRADLLEPAEKLGKDSLNLAAAENEGPGSGEKEQDHTIRRLGSPDGDINMEHAGEDVVVPETPRAHRQTNAGQETQYSNTDEAPAPPITVSYNSASTLHQSHEASQRAMSNERFSVPSTQDLASWVQGEPTFSLMIPNSQTDLGGQSQRQTHARNLIDMDIDAEVAEVVAGPQFPTSTMADNPQITEGAIAKSAQHASDGDIHRPRKRLLRTRGLLHLSKHLFLNSSNPESHFQTYLHHFPIPRTLNGTPTGIDMQLSSPALFRSAYDMLTDIVKNVTRDLLRVIYGITCSRMRREDDPTEPPSEFPLVKKRDVLDAIEVLGMPSNVGSYWAGFVGRHDVRWVYEMRGANRETEIEVERDVARAWAREGGKDLGVLFRALEARVKAQARSQQHGATTVQVESMELDGGDDDDDVEEGDREEVMDASSPREDEQMSNLDDDLGSSNGKSSLIEEEQRKAEDVDTRDLRASKALVRELLRRLGKNDDALLSDGNEGEESVSDGTEDSSHGASKPGTEELVPRRSEEEETHSSSSSSSEDSSSSDSEAEVDQDEDERKANLEIKEVTTKEDSSNEEESSESEEESSEDVENSSDEEPSSNDDEDNDEQTKMEVD